VSQQVFAFYACACEPFSWGNYAFLGRVPHCKQPLSFTTLATQEATSNPRGIQVPRAVPPTFYCRTSPFAWCNFEHLPLMYITGGPDEGSSQSLSPMGSARPNTSPHSDDPPQSGSAAAQPTDDVSTNSMNVSPKINGVMGPESHNTVNGEGRPPYASTHKKAPLGEHLADSADISRPPLRTREPREGGHRPTVDPSAASGNPQTTAGHRDTNKPDSLPGGGPVSSCSDSLLASVIFTSGPQI
jgi:hypothetical protein